MKGQMCFGLVAVFLLGSVRAADEQKYVQVGGSLSLLPQASSGPITNILWKLGRDLVGGWTKDTFPVEFYGTFNGRSNLDTTTGRLEVQNLVKGDSGLYTVEINDQVQSLRYNVSVIRPVPTPEVHMRPLTCGASGSCSLACNAIESITESEPITYSWKRDNQPWQVSTMDLSITNDEETRRVKTFSCQMKNPVSEQESEALDNPFIREETSGLSSGQIACIIIPFLILALVIAVAVWKRVELIDWFNKCTRKTDENPNSDPASKQLNSSRPE